MKIIRFLPILIPGIFAGCKEIQTETRISAPPEIIWEYIKNTDNYSSWNPFLRFNEGSLKTGNHIKITVSPPDSQPMSFEPVIQDYKEDSTNREYILVWRGNLLLPGIFTGDHSIRLKGISETESVFVHSEKFFGVLVPFVNLENTEKGFEQMNEKLKQISEESWQAKASVGK